MCSKEDGMNLVTRCDKLWKKKAGELSKRVEEKQDQGEQSHILPGGRRLDTTQAVPVCQGEQGDGCEKMKDDETLKYRRDQYENNPNMEIT
jgi:hypothetical protein